MGKYNIKEKKNYTPAYRNVIRAELADTLQDAINYLIVVRKVYKDPEYSAAKMAKYLKTNTRYLSAVINSRFNMSYTSLINEYRIREACYMLKEERFKDLTIEDISQSVGFSNRQSFYIAFFKFIGQTPNNYRKKYNS